MEGLARDLPYIDDDDVKEDYHNGQSGRRLTEPLPQQAFLATVRIHPNTSIAAQQARSASFTRPNHDMSKTNDNAWKWPLSTPPPPSNHKTTARDSPANHHPRWANPWRGDSLERCSSNATSSTSQLDLCETKAGNDNEETLNLNTLGESNLLRAAERKIGHRRVDEATGVVTYKKIESSQLMTSIQLGIKHSISSLEALPERDILIPDFIEEEEVFLPAAGSETTPKHDFVDFYFTTCMPIAFRYFRALFSIQPEDFVQSMTMQPLAELSNPGASGSVFYRTNDDRFIIKTVTKNEATFIHTLLPGYFMNYQQNPQSLLPRFLGLYYYQCGNKTIRLLVMNNLLPSTLTLHQKYDLKGSTLKRKASQDEKEKHQPTYKDLDFIEHYHLDAVSKPFTPKHAQDDNKLTAKAKYKTWDGRGRTKAQQFFGLEPGINLEASTYDEVILTLDKDALVLESFRIMDYSLLVGVHNYDKASEEAMAKGLAKPDFDFDNDSQLPIGAIRAMNSKGERLLLFMGIIDILQSFRFIKQLEHFCKSLVYDSSTISVHQPQFYSRRFITFLANRVFRKMPANSECKLKTSSLTRISINTRSASLVRRVSAPRTPFLLGRPL